MHVDEIVALICLWTDKKKKVDKSMNMSLNDWQMRCKMLCIYV